MDNREKQVIANRLSSKKYYDANKEKVRKRTREYYTEMKEQKELCKICGKEISILNQKYHLKSKKHLKYIANNSILQFVLFEKI